MISIVVSCLNEEETIPYFLDAAEAVRKEMNESFEYIFINDGSTDQTLQLLRSLSQTMENVHYLSFSRNFGKEAAMYAGLRNATGDFVTVMDADLQDPPEMLLQMKQLLDSDPELDCVGTRRIDRKGEPLIRSFFARFFYKLMNSISEVKVIDGVRDFRLMRRNMVDAILAISEYNRFSKGIFAWVGFQTIYLPYTNVDRVAGKTSWSFWKLMVYSLEGMVNFSEAPLTIASFVGLCSFMVSLFGLAFVIMRTILFGDPVSGWPSLVSIILFLSGIQLMTIGILGKYLSKVFLETKKRPLYIVKEERLPETKE